ncbi:MULTISPECIES: hypothetical protein [unclassified Pseudoalteromonas]|uniref:hypothetical protein n=1 Tax=unclassified Pseudoalteromonas TaxID=194690 RepID=UPI0016000091|nr:MULTISPECIES: hypothetical protein [unclassified Pseudoalteromonas]MBB1335849.1 hypothetical protein [Pseudoalteromonas sp. SR41-6]MBB1344173.1 hypothetical protein [Pseudoalteromonas sp. SR45-6]MBB1461396.1 hypothetical protein [Pseudoalteromonas sp. SG41-8]MBB1482061.1 hypothetical protein [Pseudoalteromonas sp. SG41-2]
MDSMLEYLGWIFLIIILFIIGGVLFRWDRESKHKKGFDYGIIIAVIILCLFSSVSFFYFSRFSFSLAEPLNKWVDAATYFNNALNPVLLIVTIILLYRTWKTSKSELEETRNLVSTQLLLEQSNRLRASCEKLQSVIKASINKYGLLSSAVLYSFERMINEIDQGDSKAFIKNNSYKQKEGVESSSELFTSVLSLIESADLSHYLKDPECKTFLKHECEELEYLKTFEDLISVFVNKPTSDEISCFSGIVLLKCLDDLRGDAVDSPYLFKEYETLYYFNLIADELVMLFDLAKDSAQRKLIESSYIRTIKLVFNEKQLDNLCYISNRDDLLELLKISRKCGFQL